MRLGAGAAFANDRISPAVAMVEHGALDWLVFECLAERTLAHGQLAREKDSAKGFNPKLAARLKAVLRPGGPRIITNMGSANPRAAGEEAIRVAREMGLSLKVAVVEGDDVTGLAGEDAETARLVAELGETAGRLIGANAYLGIDAILPALETGADVVITGRVADSSLFLAPASHGFGWKTDDWALMAAGAMAGHLLECTAQITGGYFADPGVKDVPDLARIGYPIGELEPSGAVTITKLPGTGGQITPLTVKEQLLYEVHDPQAYLTPDVSADFTRALIAQEGPDRVRVSGARGAARPDTLKVSFGFDSGFLAEAEIGYAGPGALGRAELAREIVQARMRRPGGFTGELRLDLIGVNSLHSSFVTRAARTEDVRLRAALRTFDRDIAELLLEEVECLGISGPAGGGGFRGRISPGLLMKSGFLPRDRVKPALRVLTT